MARLLAGAAARDARPSIALLEEAHRLAPDDPGIASDLSAAYWVEAGYHDDLRLRIAALGMADRALDLDPNLLPALFNRALALSAIGSLREDAREAWRRFEAVEPEQGWRQEAAWRRQQLEQPTGLEEWEGWQDRLRAALEHGAGTGPPPVPERFSQQVRLWLEDELLPAWGAAVEAGDEAAAEDRLAMAEALTRVLERRGSGRTIRQALALVVGGSPERVRDLARAHRLYGEARAFHEAQDYERAQQPFLLAAGLLERHGSPFAVWPRFQLVYIDAYGRPPDLDAALHGLAEIRSTLAAGDPVPRAYVAWMTGFVQAYRADFAASLRALREAATLFARNGEDENRCAMLVEIAILLQWTGRPDAAWTSRSEAQRLFDRLVKSRRVQNLISSTAVQLQEEGEPRLALYFFDAWVREAERSGNAMSRALAHSGRAQGRARVGRVGPALEDLERAVAASAGIPDEGPRALTRIDIAVEEADVLRGAGQFDRALATLERADDYITVAQVPLRLIDVQRRKAAIERQQGRTEDALRTLAMAEAEILRLRALLEDATQRISYLDRRRVVMEDAVDLLLELGRVGEAFAVAERMRAAELVDSLRRHADAAGFAPERPAGRPDPAMVAAGGTVVVYLSLAERLVVWTLDDERLEVGFVALGRRELAERVEAVVSEVRSSRGSPYRPGPAARRLAADLLPAGSLVGKQRLLIVPDGSLHALPFAALPAPGGDEGLLLDHVAPRLGMSVTTSRLLDLLEPALPAPAGPVLLVGVPAWDRRAFPELAPLTSRMDSSALRSLLGPPTVLAGTEATAAAFLRAYPRHGLVYFEGHSLAASRASSRGGLVLAPPGGDDDGLLEPHEIASATLPATRLVILGSCSGAGGPVSPTEGALSLVRPFLAAGTPAVIASLDSVDDAGAHALFVALAARYRQVDDPAELLRQAQLALWRDGGPDFTNGVLFQVYGSSGGVLR